MKIIKKLLFVIAGVALVAVVIMTLQSNKAKSEAKAKSVVVKPFAVSVETAERRELSNSLTLVGTFVPSREVTIASETQGRVRAVSGDIGDYRSGGSIIAQVDDELKRTAVSMAEATYEKAKRDLARIKEVQTENALPEQQLDNAAYAVETAESQLVTARRQLRDTRITVPFPGVVSARFVEIGSMVSPGTPIASIVDVSTLKLKLNVSESDIFALHLGDLVEVATDLYPGMTFAGRISAIGAKADEAHTYPVEISISNRADHPLKAGMFGRVAFNPQSKRQALVVPRTAIVGGVKNPQVFVVQNGVANLRQITVGGEVGTDVEVLKGLSLGETVVISGQNNLRDAMTVEVVK
jgi:RND family efflux transporter MFP subunit